MIDQSESSISERNMKYKQTFLLFFLNGIKLDSDVTDIYPHLFPHPE